MRHKTEDKFFAIKAYIDMEALSGKEVYAILMLKNIVHSNIIQYLDFYTWTDII